MELKQVKWGNDATLALNFETITTKEAHDAIMGAMIENLAIKDTLFQAMDDLMAHKINNDDVVVICKEAEHKLKAIKEELKGLR